MDKPTTSFTLEIQEITEVKQITDNFRKLEIIGVVQPKGDYPNFLKVQGINNMADSLMMLTPGNIVNFSCDIEGREWIKDDDRRIFMNLNITRYSIISEGDTVKKEEVLGDDQGIFDEDNDLPF